MSKVCIIALTVLTALLTGCFSFHAGALPGEPAGYEYVQLKDARIRYFDVGQGEETVLLIHGFGAALETWDYTAEQLGSKYRVVGLDLKGFGWSGRPRGDYSPAAQARLVRQFMDHLGIDRAAIVAHSWGSSVALRLALDSPDRVSKIALFDAWVFEEQLPTAFVWSRAAGMGELIFGLFYKELPEFRVAHGYYDGELATPDLVDKVDAALDRPGTTAAALAAARGQRFDQQQSRYPDIDKQVLLLWGRNDHVTPPSVGERLERTLPRSKLIVYPECGHFPMIEAAVPSTRDLAAFLAGELKVW